MSKSPAPAPIALNYKPSLAIRPRKFTGFA
jgi:hypothetical protein